MDVAITIGILGTGARADVLPWGAIQPTSAPRLDWFVAADDRWHVPEREPTVRQVRLAGTPVVETRLRVPHGDVVHRSFCVPDRGGLVVVEVENDSPLPVAVAFAGPDVVSSRPPASVPVHGIDLPPGARVLPIGHRASVTVVVPAGPIDPADRLPSSLPSAQQVVAGWLSIVHHAGRFELPDRSLVESLTAARCDLVLGPSADASADAHHDPIDFLLAAHQRVRMLGGDDDTMVGVAEAVAQLARALRRGTMGDRAGASAALDAAEAVARHVDDLRAAADVDATRRHLSGRGALGDDDRLAGRRVDPAEQATPARRALAVERVLADGRDLLPQGIPASWWGTDFEVHGVPTDPGATVSYAVRWHGERPAILWETTGPAGRLTASRAAPGWTTDAPAGEALWPAPSVPAQATSAPPTTPPESFS
jgi:hypothetical protein